MQILNKWQYLGKLQKRHARVNMWAQRGWSTSPWVTEKRPEERMCPFWEVVFLTSLQEGIILDGRNVQPEETKPSCNWRWPEQKQLQAHCRESHQGSEKNPFTPNHPPQWRVVDRRLVFHSCFTFYSWRAVSFLPSTARDVGFQDLEMD